MYRSILTLSLIAPAVALPGQTTVHQVVVLNEGHYDYLTGVQTVPVSLGSYDPAGGVYTPQVTIADARFGNDVEVENELIYVAADSFLLKYDANTFALLDQAIVIGIRRIALWNDRLILTRGELGGLPHYAEVRDKNTFDLLYVLDPLNGPAFACEDVEVHDDRAYFAINNGFDWPNYTNKVGVLDLMTDTYTTEIDLGPDGYNPENIMVFGNDIYVLNNKDFTGSSISRINGVTSALLFTENIALNSGCGASALVADKVYFMEYALNKLARFDLGTDAVLDTLSASVSAYGMLEDPIHGVLYATSTDFTTTGELHVCDLMGSVLSTVAVGVAPGRLALDLRGGSGISETNGPAVGLGPNPAHDLITVNGVPAGTEFRVLDAAGRSVYTGRLVADMRLPVARLEPGAYCLHVRNVKGDATVRFVKQ
jgi:DNA-binding beta-propeller fold protein YncE